MSDKIRVAIKVRPLVSREVESGEFWRVEGNELLLLNNNKLPTGEKFAFDHVFGKLVTNVEVFEEVVKPLVDQAVKGFNATIFAYGQTSSGKTHTMLGDNDEAGITQLAVSTMFDFMKKSEGREFLVRASYMEIYNEKVNDLLEPQNKNLNIREKEGKIVVDRLKEELVAGTAKVMTLLKRGQKIRMIGETNLNERSSRSHTIFRMIIESRFSDNGEDGTIQVSQLNLVDLAGSERTALARTSGERLKEGCAINQSLFLLSQVVSQLSEGSQFVNFRDSKLTRILQSSLGGNAHTLIICTVTPASVEFTLSTLGFASRAKAVKNKPQVNEVMSDGTLLKKYARQLEKLQTELKAAKGRNGFHELKEVENKLEVQERLNSQLQLRINNLMKTLIVAERATKSCLNRRTCCGQMMALEFAKGHLSSLGTIQEVDTSLVLTNEDFNTPYEDFEVQLLEDEEEKCSELDMLPNTESSFNSIESSILSNRASITSRNGSLSTHKVCKEDTGVKTSTSFPTTPVRLDMATNTHPSVLCANASYWQKEYSELNSFKNDESEIILDLENQLNLKKKESEELQKALAEKQEILKNTLTFQESLTQKLVERDHALENSRKEKDVYSDKFEKFKKDNIDLENQIEELKIQNNVCENQLAAFREILFKEVTSLNPRHANQITETSEPNEIINILMNCIMEKQMEIVSQLKRSSEHLDNNILKKDNSHQETENCHKDEQETPADKIRSVIAHIRTHGIQRTSESTSGKEKLESKIAELEKTVESLRETLRREGYHYSSPLWIRKGDWAISNRKMKLLEKQVQELQQEVERLKGNTEGVRSDASLLDDTLFGKCLKSPPKPPECQSCEDLKKQIAHLKDESGTKSLRISTLTMKLDDMDSDYKKIAENLEKKLYTARCENNKLRRSLEAVEAEAKRQDMRRHEGTQTDQDHVPWEKLRAQGAGSKIVDNHWKDVEINKLKYEKKKLKEVARELKKQIQQMQIGEPDVATTVQTTPCSSLPAAITRRRAALQSLLRDSNKIIAERQQPQPCTHHQRSKENPCPP